MAPGTRTALLALAALFLFSTADDPLAASPSGDLELLAGMMSGAFSSAKQAAADPEFKDVRLHSARIWRERDDAIWIYVEQALGDSLDKPYRQRVYKVAQSGPETFRSDVYELPGDPLAATGAWKTPESFPVSDPAKLERRAGCTVILAKRTNTLFQGSTDGRKCESKLRGATYATSEVKVTPEALTTWDRGYDAAGTQVWGATKGAYTFDRVTE